MADGEALAQRVLAQLVDKYEESESFRKSEPSQRRIQTKLSEAVVPGYANGLLDPDVKSDFHAALANMENCGLIELRWVKFEAGNILDRVYLVWEAIHQAYAVLGRASRRDELSTLTAELADWLQTLEAAGLPSTWAWVGAWVADVCAAATSRGRVPTHLVPADAATRRMLQRAVAGLIHQGDEPVPMRLFSKRILGHSKLFERQVQAHVVRLLRKYAWFTGDALNPQAQDDDAHLLREFGIETAHDDIAFCGPIGFRYDGQTTAIAAGDFPYGVAIDASDADRLHITQLSVSRILTIENKANYRVYVRSAHRPDELAIYLGGFASPGQRRFLRLLRSFAESSGQSLPSFHHWGDLDYGGILILQHLMTSCWPEAQPWRMEPDLLTQYADQLDPFDPPYAAKLAKLLESAAYGWAHPLVQRILAAGGTLEQEALLV